MSCYIKRFSLTGRSKPFPSSSLQPLAFLFGFLFFTDYLPQIEHWYLLNPRQSIVFAPLTGTALFGLRHYRKQMLDMDKQLIFEEPSPSLF